MAVADVYDALISKRIYKQAFPHEDAMQMIRDSNDSHFDPAMAEALNRVEYEFIEIAARFGDNP